MDRRRFLAATSLYLAGSMFARASTESPFADIEAVLGGRVGVMAVDTGNGSVMSHRADERFAMCSTFKWVLAAFVLSQVDQDEMSLDERLSYGPDDLLEYAPVARKYVDRGWLTVNALCGATVTVSDNTAANLLLHRLGGPPELTAFLRHCGDNATRLDRNEPDLNTNLPGDERDTTTPRAMTGTMNSILLGDEILSAASRARLIGWLKQTSTGLERLRAGLPGDWIAGDKTGTGVNGAANDVAIAWPPDRNPILIAAYLSESAASPDALNTAQADIARAVAARLG
ncbi:MAG TPA: class A beta-lactamase [Woeseiaceae bacterium]|nr:class A beta-lactamase [Woeseiaceae bacterium]